MRGKVREPGLASVDVPDLGLMRVTDFKGAAMKLMFNSSNKASRKDLGHPSDYQGDFT